MLVGLFCLFKFLPKDLVNAVLTAYFVLLGTFAITAAMLPFVEALVPRKLRTKSFEVKKFTISYISKVSMWLCCWLSTCDKVYNNSKMISIDMRP